MPINFQPLFEVSVWSIVYWTLAILLSAFWGWYSVEHMLQHDKEEKFLRICRQTSKSESTLLKRFRIFDAFMSDFILSLFGWISLYILIRNLQNENYNNFNIFLGSVAILCISGYGFKIAEKMKIGQ